MDKIKDALEFDTLAMTEQILKKEDYHDFTQEESMFALGLHMLHNERKEKLLKEAKDL